MLNVSMAGVNKASDENSEQPLINRREAVGKILTTITGLIGLGIQSTAEAADTRINRPTGRTHFEVRTDLDSDIINKISGGEYVAVLIGSTWCEPCKFVKEQWAKFDMGPFGKNVYYLCARNDEEWKAIEKDMDDFLVNAHDRNLRAPIFLLIHKDGDPKQKRPAPELAKFIATGAEECTSGVAEWLNKNKF